MNLTVVTKHVLSFSVERFWNEKGGMGSEKFGGACDTLEEAVTLHALATAKSKSERPKFPEWLVVCRVSTEIKNGGTT